MKVDPFLQIKKLQFPQELSGQQKTEVDQVAPEQSGAHTPLEGGSQFGPQSENKSPGFQIFPFHKECQKSGFLCELSSFSLKLS